MESDTLKDQVEAKTLPATYVDNIYEYEPPANLIRVPLDDMVAMLDKERDKAESDLLLLRAMQRKKLIEVHDLNINLMPAINNQRRANESLNRALRKVLRFRPAPEPKQPAIPADPNVTVDEVDR